MARAAWCSLDPNMSDSSKSNLQVLMLKDSGRDQKRTAGRHRKLPNSHVGNILGGGGGGGGIRRAVHQHSDPSTINHIPLGGRTGKRRRAGGDDEEEEEEGWRQKTKQRQLRKDERRVTERRRRRRVQEERQSAI